MHCGINDNLVTPQYNKKKILKKNFNKINTVLHCMHFIHTCFQDNWQYSSGFYNHTRKDI
jgi:hypothetical protein